MNSNDFGARSSTAQYDGFSSGEFGTSVNLFRGEAFFDYPLVKGIPEKNGMGIKIMAAYTSNTDRAARTDNITEPTGVLGLGWQFGYPSIMRSDTGTILPPEQEVFYYHDQGGISRLYQTERPWVIAELDGKVQRELGQCKASDKLCQILAECGIAATVGAGLRKVGEYYLLTDWVEETELKIEKNQNGRFDVSYHGVFFEPSQFDFSRIVYISRFEKWLVAKKDGSRRIFGGMGNPGALQYIVHCHGSILPSMCREEQEQAVRQWNLSKELSLWDDEINYSYIQDKRKAGKDGLEYTRACYLSAVTDWAGYRTVMEYGQKLYTEKIKEYASPHHLYSDHPAEEADGFQDRYETRYLERIITYGQDGREIERIGFTYDILELCGSCKIPGTGAKRLLTSITRELSSGGEIPPEEFTYVTGEGANLGALATITTAAGTSVQYHYTQKQLPQCSARSVVIEKEGFSHSQVWNGPGFSAVLLYNHAASLFRIYGWTGRFQSWTPQVQPFGGMDGPVEAVVLEGAVILYAASEADNRTRVVYYHENPDVLGGWTQEVDEVFQTARCFLEAGEGWFLVYGLHDGEMVRYTYNLKKRKTEREVLHGNPGHFYSAASKGTGYALLGYDTEGVGGCKSSTLTFYSLDGFGKWIAGEEILLPELEAVFDPVSRKIAVSACYSGNLYALAAAYETDSSSFYYNLYLWETAGQASEIFRSSYVVNGGKSVWDAPEAAWQPVIREHTVITGGTVLSYDGRTVLENSKLSTGAFRFSEGAVLQAAGSGYLLQSRITDGEEKEVLVQALYYGPGEGEDFSMREPVCISHEYPEHLKENGYIPSINGSTAVYDGMVYCLDEEEPFARPVAGIPVEKPSSLVNGGSFLVYTGHSGQAYSIRIANGLVSPPSLLEGELPQVQGGSDIFWAESPLGLLLYADTGDNFNEPVSHYQVAQILSDDGFGVTGKTYDYHDSDAVCDSSGRLVKYYKVDVYNGAGSGFTRYQYCNSLAGVMSSENASVPYAMDGQLENTSVYDGSGEILSQTDFRYDMVRCIADAPGAAREYPIYGSVAAKSVSETCEEGVVSVSTVEYDAYTGETSAVSSSSYNLFGDKTTVTERYYPAAAEYPDLGRQNRLSERGRAVVEWQRNDGQVQAAEARAVQFENFRGRKRSIPYGSRELRWTGKGNPYQGSLAGSYIEENRACLVDSYGNVLKRRHSSGITQVQKYDANGIYSIGSVSDAASEKEVLILSFEEYEGIPEQWQPYLTEESCIAGSRSMKLNGNVRTPFLVHHLGRGEYAASFWSIGEAGLSLEGKDVKILEGTSCQKKEGTYHILRFRMMQEGAVRIRFYNHSGKDAFVDIFSISPFGNPPVISVMKDGLVEAVVSSYGDFSRNIYDRRRKLISVYNETAAPSLSVPFYSRLSAFGSKASPGNAEIVIKYTGETGYKREAGAGDRIVFPWEPDSAKGMAVYMDVRGKGKASLSLGSVTVEQENGRWTITDGSVEKQAEGGSSGDGEWLLVAGKRLLFFFNGEYVFGLEEYKAPESMCLSGEVSFSRLLYGQGISFGIRYLDASGRVRQGQMFDGDRVTVTQNFYDSENRIIAQTKPVEFENIPFGYLHGFASLDRDTGMMSGLVAEAYPEDEGYPYASQAYEATPVGRKIESGLPGKEYGITPEVARKDRKTVRVGYGPVKIPGLSLQDGRYHYITTDSPDGNRTVSILNSQKQQAAVAALGGNLAVLSASDKVYTSAGCTETNYLPGYFEGKKQSVRVKKYDYAGRLVSQSEPWRDGETKYCYTLSGERRFAQTPQHREEGRFLYQKYDKLHRIIEEGVCFDPWEQAAACVDDPGYPSRNYARLCAYEYGDSVKNLSALSNLSVVRSYKEDGMLEYEEHYEYDAAGRRIAREVRLPGVDRGFQERQEYDRDGNVAATVSTDGTRIVYAYDGAGRKTQEAFADGRRIASFSYGANDMLRRIETDGGIAEYQYTSAGWIKQIKSPLMEENITYQGTRIREFTVRLCIEPGEVPDFVRYVMEYDDLGRLASALCYDGEKLLEDISISSVQYDGEGNILQMEAGGRMKEYLYGKDSGRLMGIGREDGFSYNADGAVTSAGDVVDKIRYKNGKPVAFQKDGREFLVVYGADGNRLLKTGADGERTVLLYNGDNRLSEEVSVEDGMARQYLYGQFGLRTILGRDGVKDVYTDHLGSPRVVGEHGKPVAAAQYTPYGRMMAAEGEMPAGYNGYGYDRETGLYYSSYRLYDPEIGRFYSVDPKEGNGSPYVFCGNDPINRMDPEGDSWWSALLGVVVGIIGVAASVITAGACIPATLASETALLAETVVGAVAGAVGSVAGALVTAACDKQPITGKMVAGSLISGAIGGLGSVAGPLGQAVMRSLMNAGAQCLKITIAGAVTGCTVGAAAGIGGSLAYSAVTDTPVSGASIAIAGLAGMGTGLLATRAVYGLTGNTLPVMIRQGETGSILRGERMMAQNVMYNNQMVNIGNEFQRAYQNTNFFSFITDEQFYPTGMNMLRNRISPFEIRNVAGAPAPANPQNAAVIACHGFGRHCFVAVEYGGRQVYRPVAASTFIQYFAQDPVYQAVAANASYVKLFICFSGSRPGVFSTAKKFATALQNTVYGTRGITYPEHVDQQYLRF